MNTKQIQSIMRLLVSEHCDRIEDTQQFVGIVADMLPNYDEERILLINVFRAGLLDYFLNESDRRAAVANAREFLEKDLELQENEVEFVLVVVTYMLKMRYISKLIVRERSKANEQTEQKTAPVLIDLKVYRKVDALIHRLSRKIIVKEGFTKIDSYCFDSFGMVKSISLPHTLLAIGEYAFTDCKKLTDIDIPSSVKKIDKGAFNACVSLKNIRLPDGERKFRQY